jgi:hypothetical protein
MCVENCKTDKNQLSFIKVSFYAIFQILTRIRKIFWAGLDRTDRLPTVDTTDTTIKKVFFYYY